MDARQCLARKLPDGWEAVVRDDTDDRRRYGAYCDRMGLQTKLRGTVEAVAIEARFLDQVQKPQSQSLFATAK